MKSIGPALVLLASPPALAAEIYHWVDENGVSHYTQSAPPPDVAGVIEVTLEDTTPPIAVPAPTVTLKPPGSG